MSNSAKTTTKICNKCNQPKPIAEFPKWRRACKDCVKEEKRLSSIAYYREHKNSSDFKAKREACRQRRITANREAYLAQKHETYLRNKEWYNSNWHVRRAIAAGADVIDRTITISKLLERDNYTCAICGIKISQDWESRSAMPSIDHIMPLSLGGQHSWDNVRAVHLGCNNSKAGKKDGEFVPNPSFLRE